MLRDAISAAAVRLADVSETPRLDAELLAAHLLGVEREELLLWHLGKPVPDGWERAIRRRLESEPLAYITGVRDFWTLRLFVAPGVLIPRPDSETLIEAALEFFHASSGPFSVLDLGTGSGALLLSALSEWPSANGLGIDCSATALEIAATNARANGLDGRAQFRQGNWASGIADRFDLILCNPPYIADDYSLMKDVAAYEPASALFAGRDGLDAYRCLAPQIAARLTPHGCACVEIGYDQAAAAHQLFEAAGLRGEIRLDLAGRPRCLVLTQRI